MRIDVAAVFIVLFLAVLTVSAFAALTDEDVPSTASWHEGENIVRTFTWEYSGVQHLELKIPESTYDAYRFQQRYSFNDVGKYITEDRSGAVEKLAEALKNMSDAGGLTESQRMDLAVVFVQSLPYYSDGSVDTPRFPVETIVDGGGDCEDTSILLAAILYEWGYDVVLLNIPDVHTAVGVVCYDCDGSFVVHGEIEYYYVETAWGGSWEIGQMPGEYRVSQFIVFEI